MKLAEALSERSDIHVRMDQIADRLNNNARVQEGDRPAEDPAELVREYDLLAARLEDLVTRINLTNSRTISEGETLTALLARRDCLTLRVNTLRVFLHEASALTGRGTRSEIRVLSSVDVPTYRKRADDLSRELRALDVRIQGLNWTTELE